MKAIFCTLILVTVLHLAENFRPGGRAPQNDDEGDSQMMENDDGRHEMKDPARVALNNLISGIAQKFGISPGLLQGKVLEAAEKYGLSPNDIMRGLTELAQKFGLLQGSGDGNEGGSQNGLFKLLGGLGQKFGLSPGDLQNTISGLAQKFGGGGRQNMLSGQGAGGSCPFSGGGRQQNQRSGQGRRCGGGGGGRQGQGEGFGSCGGRGQQNEPSGQGGRCGSSGGRRGGGRGGRGGGGGRGGPPRGGMCGRPGSEED